MHEEKKIGITMAKTVHENAPIKYAEVIEGMSDVDQEEKETVRAAESASRMMKRESHVSADEGSMLHEEEEQFLKEKESIYVGPVMTSSTVFFDLTLVGDAQV